GGPGADELSVIIQTTDKGYVFGGSSSAGIGGDKSQPNNSINSGWDYWIVKTDSIGNKEWDRDFGGAGDDNLYSLIQTKDGGYILAGSTDSDSSGDVSIPARVGGLKDFWVVKIDAGGNKQWDGRYGGTANEVLHSVLQSDDGGYLFGGIS